MAVKWLREKCLFLPDYRPFGRRGVHRDGKIEINKKRNRDGQ